MSALRPVPFLARPPAAAAPYACLRLAAQTARTGRPPAWRASLLQQQQQQQHRQAQAWARPRHGLPVSVRCCPIRAYTSSATPGELTPPTPPPRSRFRRAVAFVFRAVFSFALGGGLVVAVAAAVTIYRLRALPDENPLLAAALDEPAAGSDAADPADPAAVEARTIRRHLAGHPLVAALEADPRWRPRHPHRRLPHVFRKLNLTAGTLIGPGRLVVEPLLWVNDAGGFDGVAADPDAAGAAAATAAADAEDAAAGLPPPAAGTDARPSLVMVTHLGKELCGHPNIVHGGLVATLLDEGLARCCFGALPGKVGMTAYLNIDYRAPTPADGCVALYAQTVKAKGRKALVRGRLVTLPAPGSGEKPVVLAEAEGLFVSPRNAWLYSSIANLFQ